MTDKLRQAVETAEGIVNANWRNWQELASQEEFERWVKGRSHHIAALVRQALAESPNSTTNVVEPEPEEPLTLEEQREAQQQLENHLDAVYQRNDHAFLAQAQLGQPETTNAIPELWFNGKAMYSAPPKRDWVSLTDEEVGALTVFDGLHDVEIPLLADFIRAIEANLKDKNTCNRRMR